MSFDRSKAMRNAERHVAQGKIRSAISEYKNVVENDPRDFGTLNMLGDLYLKDSEKNEAVRCYTLVAEHYSKQGFSQKAIAVYNKISRLQPNSVEISAKLAELYKTKGSVSEAKSHYTTLAEHYQAKGRVIEALAIWKQIALLDASNTEVYLNIAESYVQENQEGEAADAYTEAGYRFAQIGRHDEAINCYRKALDIRSTNLPTLKGLVAAYGVLGRPEEAAAALEKILEDQPYNRDVLSLLIDAHVSAQKPAEAEKAVVKLVEQEPANYVRFMDLFRIYMAGEDLDSAARILSMTSEHLLVGGQAEDFEKWVSEILAKDPEQLTAVRLMARYHSWQRDDEHLQEALKKLATLAAAKESIDDERYALSQLVMIVPGETGFADRLREINEQYGFQENPFDETILKERFVEDTEFAESADTGNFAVFSSNGTNLVDAGLSSNGTSEQVAETITGNDAAHVEVQEPFDHPADAIREFEANAAESVDEAPEILADTDTTADGVKASGETAVDKEIESIRFYIENGYMELAEKALTELRAQFGERAEFDELGALIVGTPDTAPAEEPKHEAQPESVVSEQIVAETEPVVLEQVVAEPVVAESEKSATKTFDLDELRSEFGLEEPEPVDDGDYDTRYQMAVAYQEMGLTEEAIKEYQDAINQVKPNDGTRRFFQCANLLGHCFMQQGMAKLAVRWYNRALETPDLNDDEKQGLWYELAGAFEANGDTESAAKYFEQVYAENVDFRDVGERIKNLMVSR